MQTSTPSPFDPCVWFAADPLSDSVGLARESAPFAKVMDRGLQPSVEIAARLLRLLEDPEFDTAEVAALIERDQALAARVLRGANSPMFALRQPCKTVPRAVTMLGARTIGELAAAAAAADLFGRGGVEARLRSHAVGTAVLARELARQLRRPDRDLFVAGLMHDLGKLVLLQGAGGERYGLSGLSYQELLVRRVGHHGGTQLLEQAALGFDHAAMGRAALEAWDIPEPIPTLVGLHHAMDRARQQGGRTAEAVALLRVADCLAHSFAGPRMEDEAARLLLQEPVALEELGLEAEELALMLPQLQHLHASAASLLD